MLYIKVMKISPPPPPPINLGHPVYTCMNLLLVQRGEAPLQTADKVPEVHVLIADSPMIQ